MDRASASFSILIADDNEMNRWLLDEQLQLWSDDIALACDGVEAWSLLQVRDYDLAFIDVNMPVVDGLTLVKKIRRQLTRNPPLCVAVTAHAQTQQIQLLLSEGFDECLIKPIVLADLQRIVSQRIKPCLDGSPESYADVLLKKVEYNQELGRVLLNKLLEQAPDQLDLIDQAVLSSRFHDAWSVAHKLHGSLSFIDFADFRQLAMALEQSLSTDDADNAGRQIKVLREKFADLKAHRDVMLARLGR